MASILEADSIRLSFGNRVVLSDIYIKCETGKITGLLGRNGQGKTCLLNVIAGTLNAAEKSIRYNRNSQAQPLSNEELLKCLPQYNFVPTFLTMQKVFKDFALDFAQFEKIFPEFSGKHNFKFRQLSGGQRRVAETYLVIKSKTKFSLLDEPFTHLMPLQIEKVTELIKEEKLTKGFLITDHLYREVTGIADDLYVLAGGQTRPVTKQYTLQDAGYL